jgi:hypothetical protein
MSRITDPFKCDGCDTPKMPSNNWLIGLPSLTVHIQPTLADGSLCTVATSAIALLPWDDKLADLPDAKHLCGVECSQKFVGKEVSRTKGAKNEAA